MTKYTGSYSYDKYLAGDYGDSQSSRYKTGLAESKKRYEQMLAEARKYQEVASQDIASEYKELANLYRTGGQYGRGARSSIIQSGKEGLAETQARLARTGMSSGSLAMTSGARYRSDINQALQTVEDARYEKLSGALATVAAAKEYRKSDMKKGFLSLAELMGSYQDPNVSKYANEEQLQGNRYIYSKRLQTQGEEAQAALQKASQAFQESQANKYNLTAKQKMSVYNPNTTLTKPRYNT